jgi:hypothetical protein
VWWDAHFDGGALHQRKVDDACPSFQPGYGGRGTAEPVAEHRQRPSSVFPAQADQSSGLPLGG